MSSESAIAPVSPTRVARALGVVILGGRAVTLVPGGSHAPFSRSRVFTTVTNGQRAVEIRVVTCGGERSISPPIARFLLAGIRRGVRGEARIEIGISLEAGGVLRAWAAEIGGMAREQIFFSATASVFAGAVSGDSIVSLMDRVCQDWPSFSQAGRKEHEAEEIREWLSSSPAELRREDACGRGFEGVLALQTLAGEIASAKRFSSLPSGRGSTPCIIERPSDGAGNEARHER